MNSSDTWECCLSPFLKTIAVPTASNVFSIFVSAATKKEDKQSERAESSSMLAEAGIEGDRLAEEPSYPLGCSGMSELQYLSDVAGQSGIRRAPIGAS
jgi:hypothetical protein